MNRVLMLAVAAAFAIGLSGIIIYQFCEVCGVGMQEGALGIVVLPYCFGVALSVLIDKVESVRKKTSARSELEEDRAAEDEAA